MKKPVLFFSKCYLIRKLLREVYAHSNRRHLSNCSCFSLNFISHSPDQRALAARGRQRTRSRGPSRNRKPRSSRRRQAGQSGRPDRHQAERSHPSVVDVDRSRRTWETADFRRHLRSDRRRRRRPTKKRLFVTSSRTRLHLIIGSCDELSKKET